MGYLMDNEKFKLVDEEAKIFQRTWSYLTENLNAQVSEHIQ
jgi:hypothetical protein